MDRLPVRHHGAFGAFHLGPVHTGLFEQHTDGAEVDRPRAAVAGVKFFVPFPRVIAPTVLVERLGRYLGHARPPFMNVLHHVGIETSFAHQALEKWLVGAMTACSDDDPVRTTLLDELPQFILIGLERFARRREQIRIGGAHFVAVEEVVRHPFQYSGGLGAGLGMNEAEPIPVEVE